MGEKVCIVWNDFPAVAKQVTVTFLDSYNGIRVYVKGEEDPRVGEVHYPDTFDDLLRVLAAGDGTKCAISPAWAQLLMPAREKLQFADYS